MKTYISSVQKQFKYYKSLGDKTFAQLSDEQLLSALNANGESQYSSSVAVIVKHISGNMLSRWTDVFTSDGEKSWRNRDGEFQATINTREDLLDTWDTGWKCLFAVIDNLTIEDLAKTVYIRNMGHSLVEAINRQMMHYAYHIGQIVFLGKEWKGDQWQSLSIPLGNSELYNAEKFSAEKSQKHFTDEFLEKK